MRIQKMNARYTLLRRFLPARVAYKLTVMFAVTAA